MDSDAAMSLSDQIIDYMRCSRGYNSLADLDAIHTAMASFYSTLPRIAIDPSRVIPVDPACDSWQSHLVSCAEYVLEITYVPSIGHTEIELHRHPIQNLDWHARFTRFTTSEDGCLNATVVFTRRDEEPQIFW